jgi:hypothetical protein
LKHDDAAMARNFDTLVRPLDVGDVPLYGSGRARRVARRKSILKTCATCLAVVLAAGGLYVATQRSAASPVTLDEVIQRFHEGDERLVDDTDVPEPERGSERQAPVRPVASAPEKAEQVSAETAPVKDAADILPAEGVYAYRTTGGEQISLFGARHDYPERTFATVRHLGGCRWEARNDVVDEHTDFRTLCNDNDSFLQLAQERQVEFFGQRDGASMTCDPPLTLYTAGDAIGTRTATDCRDADGNNAHLTSVYLGTDELKIGGEVVKTIHVRDDGIVKGPKMDGTSMDELWLHPRTGVTLRWNRTVDTTAAAFGGARVRYTEEATFLLESLEPRG